MSIMDRTTNLVTILSPKVSRIQFRDHHFLGQTQSRLEQRPHKFKF